jgi:hypothetical protein
MKAHETPQDNIKTLGGFKKALYALDEQGRYTTCATSGWEVEEIVLLDALVDYGRKAEAARAQALENRISPIAYFMHLRYMDPITLAQAMGLFRWQVKRHLRPEVFRKLNDSMLQRYADLFRVPVRALKRFEEEVR